MSRDVDPVRSRLDPARPASTAADVPVPHSQRWLSRLAFLLAVAAVVVLVVGSLTQLGVLAVGVLGLALTLAALWWFVSTRGVRRWLAACLAVAAPVAVITWYVTRHRLWEIVVVVLLLVAASGAAQAALVRARPPSGMPEHDAKPVTHPFLIMNPR
ncbi:MAG: hypothetical protein ACJ786_09695, partial [Catenulispora sp.]